MRLDKYLGEAGVATRSEATKRIRRGDVSVDGVTVRDPAKHIDPEHAAVTLSGEPVIYRRFLYVMLNKPQGYVSATEDRGPTVMELLPPQFVRMGLFPCGRLDIDTTGFLLVTNDGVLGHELLSPRHHVDKTYRYTCLPPIDISAISALEAGVDIGGLITKPAHLSPTGALPSGEGTITIREGKFHQIKRMFHAVGSEITSLERISFGDLPLDASLERGQWRYLTDEEEEILRRAAGRHKEGTDTPQNIRKNEETENIQA